MQPNGMIIRQEIENYLWSLHKNKGYSRVWTPHIAKEALTKHLVMHQNLEMNYLGYKAKKKSFL